MPCQPARRTGWVQHPAAIPEGAHGVLRGTYPLFRRFYLAYGQGDGVVLRAAAHGVDQGLAFGQHGFRQFLGRNRVISPDAQSDDAGFRVKGGFYCPIPIGKALIPRGIGGQTADEVILAAGEVAENVQLSVNGLHDVRGLDVFGHDMRGPRPQTHRKVAATRQGRWPLRWFLPRARRNGLRRCTWVKPTGRSTAKTIKWAAARQSIPFLWPGKVGNLFCRAP